MLGEVMVKAVVVVAVDHGSLSSEEDAMGTLYRVRLTCEPSDRWCAAFRMGQRGEAVLSRFHLDEASSSVGFSMKRNQGPADVMEMLDRLAEFVEKVNREAP